MHLMVRINIKAYNTAVLELQKCDHYPTNQRTYEFPVRKIIAQNWQNYIIIVELKITGIPAPRAGTLLYCEIAIFLCLFFNLTLNIAFNSVTHTAIELSCVLTTTVCVRRTPLYCHSHILMYTRVSSPNWISRCSHSWQNTYNGILVFLQVHWPLKNCI